MKSARVIAFIAGVIAVTFFSFSAQAKPRATVKLQTIRAENPQKGMEWLVLPYGFSTDGLGTVLGV